ncbi:MAG: hypothetical protein AAFY60_05150 [Myxococcota bacterium]
MSEAASVGGKEALMGKQYVDEVKFGGSFVHGKSDCSEPVDRPPPARQIEKPVTRNASPERSSSSGRSRLQAPNRAAALAGVRQPAPLERVENAQRSVSIAIPAVVMPAFAAQSQAAWHGAVEADPSLLEALWDDERTPKGVIQASRRHHRRVHGVGAENRSARLARHSRWFAVLAMVDPWIAAAELDGPKPRA